MKQRTRTRGAEMSTIANVTQKKRIVSISTVFSIHYFYFMFSVLDGEACNPERKDRHSATRNGYGPHNQSGGGPLKVTNIISMAWDTCSCFYGHTRH